MSTLIVSDVESVASELAIMRNGKLIGFDTPDNMIEQARGKVWSLQLPIADAEHLRQNWQVLHAQRQHSLMTLRIAHPTQPHSDAVMVLPNLEDALMAQRYSLQEVA